MVFLCRQGGGWADHTWPFPFCCEVVLTAPCASPLQPCAHQRYPSITSIPVIHIYSSLLQASTRYIFFSSSKVQAGSQLPKLMLRINSISCLDVHAILQGAIDLIEFKNDPVALHVKNSFTCSECGYAGTLWYHIAKRQPAGPQLSHSCQQDSSLSLRPPDQQY